MMKPPGKNSSNANNTFGNALTTFALLGEVLSEKCAEAFEVDV